MSDTPKTDAGAFWVTSPTDPEMREEVVVSHFARQLERELNEIIERCAQACGGKGDWRGQECADAIRALKGWTTDA